MTKKLFTLVAIVLVASMALAACAPAATPAPVVEPTAVPVEPTAVPVVEPTAVPPTEVPPLKPTKVCQVTDTGGIDDKSFNDTAWKGVQDGVRTLVWKVITFNPLSLQTSHPILPPAKIPAPN